MNTTDKKEDVDINQNKVRPRTVSKGMLALLLVGTIFTQCEGDCVGPAPMPKPPFGLGIGVAPDVGSFEQEVNLIENSFLPSTESLGALAILSRQVPMRS